MRSASGSVPGCPSHYCSLTTSDCNSQPLFPPRSGTESHFESTMKWGRVSLWAMLRPAVSTYSDEMLWLSRRFVLSLIMRRGSATWPAPIEKCHRTTFHVPSNVGWLWRIICGRTVDAIYTDIYLVVFSVYNLSGWILHLDRLVMLFIFNHTSGSGSKRASFVPAALRNTWPSRSCGPFSFIPCCSVKL